jgi:3-dehydroquinate synthase
MLIMEVLKIKTDLGESRLLSGERIENLHKYLPDCKLAIITDENIKKYYQQYFPQNALIITVGLGETNKTMATLEKIFDELISAEYDRSCFILGIGGGIITDITGFVASIYLRGVRFGFVSTTLLAQVDASIGGKNGVNFKGYKNMIGVFNQPEFVILDYNMLKTLPKQEFTAGFAEIIKHAAIRDMSLFDFMENNIDKALSGDERVLHRLVYDSLVIKSAVVQTDEKEKGLRRILNFGHTLGHAVEKLTGIIHGQAVSIGMVAAARLSVKKGLLTQVEAERLEKLIAAYGLPVKITVDKARLIEAMKKDKKREQEMINFVLLSGLGSAVIEGIEIKQLEEIVNDLC